MCLNSCLVYFDKCSTLNAPNVDFLAQLSQTANPACVMIIPGTGVVFSAALRRRENSFSFNRSWATIFRATLNISVPDVCSFPQRWKPQHTHKLFYHFFLSSSHFVRNKNDRRSWREREWNKRDREQNKEMCGRLYSSTEMPLLRINICRSDKNSIPFSLKNHRMKMCNMLKCWCTYVCSRYDAAAMRHFFVPSLTGPLSFFNRNTLTVHYRTVVLAFLKIVSKARSRKSVFWLTELTFLSYNTSFFFLIIVKIQIHGSLYFIMYVRLHC